MTFLLCASALTGCGGSGGSSSGGGGGSTAAPTITSLSPAAVLVGSSDTTVTLAGSGFTSSTSVAFNGTTEATTYVSGTQVTAVLPAAQLATAASLTLTASNGSAASAPVGFTINNPAPVISSLSSTSVTLGSASTVTVTGTGFVPTSSVLVNGTARTTTYSSATRLTFTLSATDVGATGTLAVTVSNAAPGGGASTATNIQVVPPTPSISSLAPASVTAGASDTVLTLTGTGFTSTTAVTLNGSALATTYFSATQVKATLPAAQLASATTLSLAATNGSGSGVSVAASFTVNNPAPTISSLSTSSLVAGSIPASITVCGTGFVNTSAVLVNGAARTPTFVSGTQLSFTSTATDTALPGVLAISVTNAQPGGGVSAALNITVAAATPTATGVSPNSVAVGATDTTVTLTGTNFLSTSVVMTGTTTLATTYVSSTQLTAVIPTANLASLGWLPLTVSTPSASSMSGTLTLPVVKKIQLNANRMVYDPYNRKLWVTIGAAASTLAGSSLVSIDPATGVIGTPLALSGTPYALAISDSGKTIYALTATLVYRLDVQTNALSQATVPGITSASTLETVSGFAIAPGTENTFVLGTSSLGNDTLRIYDYDVPTNTLTSRSGAAGMPSHYGYCPLFLDGADLINPYNTPTRIDVYPVTGSGLGSSSATLMQNSLALAYGCLKGAGQTGFDVSGNVYTISATSIARSATINLTANAVFTSFGSPIAPDLSLKRVFFGTEVGGNGPASLTSASTSTNLVDSVVVLPSAAPGGYADDLYRWGADGLAALYRDDFATGAATIYLLRGPFVVPQELTINTAAILSAASPATLAAGSGNTQLTLTGSNFVPGVAVAWNGSYRTTTMTDATHLTVYVSAADVASAGTATLTATNPGGPASASVTVTIQ